MIKFIVKSYSFKWTIIITIVFIILTIFSGKLFDSMWNSRSSIPIINLNDVYKPPLQYDNFNRINLKLISKELLAIEGNRRFKIKDNLKDFNYYDTVKIEYPETASLKINIIYLQFENSAKIDSLYAGISKSPEPDFYYNQVFLSSVIVDKLNDFSDDVLTFRIKQENLVNPEYLSNNDSLINEAFRYFNDHKDSLGLSECGINCGIFKKICADFNVPFRIVGLQGGDADQIGYNERLGYPLHVVCEIYSSASNKWYVVDPSYGLRFKVNSGNQYLNAVEISNKYTFMQEHEILQDSILFTKRSLVGRDYFKFYENVLYKIPVENKTLVRFLKVFYPEFNYFIYHYSNNYPPIKNGFYYIGIKSFVYFFLLILYINSILFVLTKRLISVKKPK